MSSTKSSSSSWSHSTVCVNGHKLTVVDFGYDRFLIGAQVAQILARETFNMYRSMKIKRINIRRANPAEVAYLVRAEAVRIGTHSITLIPEALGLYFIADATVGSPKQCSNCECCAIRELSALKTKSFLVTKPKLHRRKALPWNIHRSLRKEDIERIHSDGFVRASSIATSPSASPLRSSNSSLISRSSSPFDEEASLSRSSSPISDSSIASSSSSSSSSLLEALTSYAGSPVAQDLTITFEASSSTTSDKEVDTMQQEQQEQEQEQDSTQFERPIPPPLSPLSPSHSSSSASDSDSLPEASPERVAPRKSPLLLPTFDRPLYCGFPIGGPVSSTPAASSFLMYSASY